VCISLNFNNRPRMSNGWSSMYTRPFFNLTKLARHFLNYKVGYSITMSRVDSCLGRFFTESVILFLCLD